MLIAILRWLGRNLSTLLISFILAVVVWVSSVTAQNPTEQRTFRPVPIEIEGRSPELVLIGDVPTQANVTLSAPRSIWTRLENDPELVDTWIDLSGLPPGEHTIPVQVRVDINPKRIIRVVPETVHFVLEPLVTQRMPVELAVEGDAPRGYRKGTPEVEPNEVTISGPQSEMVKVAHVQASVNVSGIRETKRITIPVEAVDNNGDVISKVNITPRTVTVTQPITLEGGYRNVVVRVVTEGQPARGYRITSISVTPLNVTVFSANPQLVNDIPGYVETRPLNLNGLSDDVEYRVELDLPDAVSLVGEQSVLVQVGIATMEGNLTISLPVEVLGLPPDMAALISSQTVDVTVSGPIPVLDTLTQASFRAIIDLTNLEAGVHQVAPLLDLIPDEVEIRAIEPATIEVTILNTPFTTPTPALVFPTTPTPTRLP